MLGTALLALREHDGSPFEPTRAQVVERLLGFA
jgi:hypothetical protein